MCAAQVSFIKALGLQPIADGLILVGYSVVVVVVVVVVIVEGFLRWW